jgi:hypothetical protein
LVAAEKSGKYETPEADEAFTTIRNQLKRFTMLTPEGKGLLDIFMNISDTPATIQANESVLCTVVSKLLKECHQSKSGRRKKITFVLLKSLDEHGILASFKGSYPLIPTVFHHSNDPLAEIDDPTPVPEILWMFSCRKGDQKLTFRLQDNPHFYHKFPLKASESEFDSRKDGKGFHRDPLTEIGPGLEQTDTVFIIPDKPCRLYLDVAEPRVFGNLWHPRRKVILKGE